MEMDSRDFQPLIDRLTARTAGSYPPRPVLEAMMTLLGPGGDPVAALGHRAQSGGAQGAWTCVALTEDRLIHVTAQSNDPDWDLTSHVQNHTQLTARSWSRADIARVDITDVDRPDREFGTSWQWRAALKIVMKDGNELSLPPDGRFPSGADAAEYDNLIRQLCGG